jgi:hypothetical protein
MSISPEWVQAISSALLVVLTTVTLIVLWGYARDTKTISGAAKDSADAAKITIKQMRRSARKELRARTFVASAKRTTPTNPGVFIAEVTFKNFGKVPAYRCTYKIGLILDTYPPVDAGLPVLNATGREPKFVLPPGGEVRLSKALPAGTFAGTQEKLVMQESHAVYLYGQIDYKDGFGADRYSRFLMKCSGSDFSTGSFSFCERGNHAN